MGEAVNAESERAKEAENQLKDDITDLQTALIGVDALADAITEVVGA